MDLINLMTINQICVISFKQKPDVYVSESGFTNPGGSGLQVSFWLPGEELQPR